jgi:hypothetical protein
MLPFQTENRSPDDFSLIRLLFAHSANSSFSFIRWFTNKQTEVINLQMDQTDLPIHDR